MTVEADIFSGLINHLNTWTLPDDWTTENNIAYPGVTFVPVQDIPFIQTKVHYNKSIETDLSLELPPIRQGFLQANTMWPKGWGHRDPVDIAGSIRDHFKRGTIIIESGIQIRIDEDPELGVIFEGSTHDTVPLTVTWIVYP